MPILVVNPALAATTLTFSASPNPAPDGSPVTFSATLSGGLSSPDQPTGDISAGFYTSPTCSNSPAFTLDVSPDGVDGNGTYTSAPVTSLAPGTYYGNAYFADTDGYNASASSGSCNYTLVVQAALPWWWIWWLFLVWYFWHVLF